MSQPTNYKPQCVKLHPPFKNNTFQFNIHTNQSTKLIVVPSISNNFAVIHKIEPQNMILVYHIAHRK